MKPRGLTVNCLPQGTTTTWQERSLGAGRGVTLRYNLSKCADHVWKNDWFSSRAKTTDVHHSQIACASLLRTKTAFKD